ncbi:MAG: RodZ domain-containing protein [Candidatus Omnitrophota bacterium]
MESIGARLKKIRLEKGFTLEDVHKATRIHISILKGIEEDGLINISPIYTRGFLKNYCKFLGENPADYITDYRESQAPLIAKSGQKHKKSSLLRYASLSILSIKSRFKAKAFLAVIAGIFAVVIVFNLGKAIVTKIGSFLHRPRQASTVASGRAQKTGQAAAAVNPRQREISLPANSGSGVRLTIYARENCFLEVKSDGKVMFKGRLRKGRSESWRANSRIELSLSNAGAVDLQINSRHIASLGAKGQSLKNIVITKDSLVIPR